MIPGLTKTTPFHYKKVNGQMGSVLIHQGMLFLLTIDWGLVSGGKPYGKFIPPCKIYDTVVEYKPIDFEKDQVIDGRFISWQEGGECWLFITPINPSTLAEQTSPPHAVLYHKYRG